MAGEQKWFDMYGLLAAKRRHRLCRALQEHHVCESFCLLCCRVGNLGSLSNAFFFFRVCAECMHASVKQHDCMTVCIVEETPTTDEWQGDRIETRFGWRER